MAFNISQPWCGAGRTHGWMRVCLSLLVIVTLSLPAWAGGGDDAPEPAKKIANKNLVQAIKAVCSVGVNGQGHEAAVSAMEIVNAATIDQVPTILTGMDGANRLAINWLRSSVLSIVRRGQDLPREEIEEFFSDTAHHPLARLLAFDLLTAGDQTLAEKMIPDLIDDPSLPLRAKAIEWRIKKSESASTDEQRVGMLAVALDKARDVDQVTLLANRLQEHGIAIDLQTQLGFLNTWQIVGSFDNKNRAGFDVDYGPEKSPASIDLTAVYQDNGGQSVGWHEHTTSSSTGVVDLNHFLAKVKEVAAYAFTTFDAVEEAHVEIRIGSPNATKIWVNGDLVMSNEIYHNSNSIDKFVGLADLKPGKNEILVKVCQNEQAESWTENWEFQLRICDASGKVIHPVSK